MTENLLQKLEEKMMIMLTEIEDSRREIHRLTHENAGLKVERETSTRKLQDLITLLDSMNATDNLLANLVMPVAKPVLVQVEG